MITDLDNNPITVFNFAMASAGVLTMSVKIDCKTDYRLTCSVTANIVVEGRKSGDVSWTNLESSFIDLSAYDGTRQTFEIRLTGASVSVRTRVKPQLRVAKP